MIASDGSCVSVRLDTICLHGDALGISEIAPHVRGLLTAEGIAVAPLSMA